jgi:hypothetical protein
MAEKAVLDRVVDGQYAVLLVGEAGVEHVIPVDSLPEGTRPGTWLRVQFEDDVLVDAVVDVEETERVKKRIEEKLARLRQRGRRVRQDKPEE